VIHAKGVVFGSKRCTGMGFLRTIAGAAGDSPALQMGDSGSDQSALKLIMIEWHGP